LKVFIIEYYKRLFEALIPSNFSMVEDFDNDIPKFPAEESSILTDTITGKGVFEAIS
jgi:hypothetical protein